MALCTGRKEREEWHCVQVGREGGMALCTGRERGRNGIVYR